MTIAYKLITVLIFIFLLVSCRKNETDSIANVVSIDMDNVERESAKDWFESIELIPLATTDGSLIKEVFKIMKFNGNYYIYDGWQHAAFEFDSIGNFVNSTKPLQGSGPNEFVSFLDFDIDKVNGNWHILDHVSSKIRIYDKDMLPVNSYDVDKDLLPLQYFKYIKDNLYVFYCPSMKKGDYVVKYYKADKKKVLKKELPTIIEKADYLPNVLYSPFYEFNEQIFFTQKYSNNDLFKIDDKNLCLEKYIQYDFGEHTFNVEDIERLESENPNDYVNYMDNNSKDKAFIFNKCESDLYHFISVYYKHCIYIIKHDKSTGKNKAIVNDYSKKGSLGRPMLLDNDYYYCVVGPEYLNILVEDLLLTEKAKIILSKLKEDDNPVIIKYKLKK